MAIFPVNVDYTQRDKRSIMLRLQGLIRSVHPEWTDFNTAGFDNILLESMAHNGDILAYYQDGQARELFWSTVTQRSNAIRLGRHINFQLRSARPATSTERFLLITPRLVDVTIPEGTIVRTPSPSAVPFRTTELATIVAGTLYVDVPVEQAELIRGENYPSTGGPNQRIQLSQSPYIDDTAEVTSGDSGITDPYLQVSSFLDPDPVYPTKPIGPTSKVFVVVVDEFDRAILCFGNGKSGKIPQGNIVVNYKIGGGLAGNVDAGEIKVLDGTIYDVGGQSTPITVSNTVQASGGLNRETVLQARARGPQSLRVLERCVAKEDFELTALSVPGIIRAVMITSNEDAAVQENSGILLTVATGTLLPSGSVSPAVPSTTLLQQVYTAVVVGKPPTLTFTLQSFAATFRTINVSTRVYLEAGQTASEVGEAVRESVRDFFAALKADGTKNPEIDFGANIKKADGTVVSEIAWSKVFNAINDTVGVRKVDEGAQGMLLNSLRASVSLSPREFPVVGTIQVIDADTGAGI